MPKSSEYIYPTLAELEDSGDWQTINEQATSYAKVLAHKGLLTDELAKIAKHSLRVECIAQQFAQNRKEQRRDVVIFVDDVARVLASTIIPASVLDNYPSLLTLGNNPIGEHLESRYAAIRSTPSIRKLPPKNKLDVNFINSSAYCLRKYNYQLERGAITIVELFSTEILELLTNNSQ